MWVCARKSMFCKGAATLGLNKVGGIMIKATRSLYLIKVVWCPTLIKPILNFLSSSIEALLIVFIECTGSLVKEGKGKAVQEESRKRYALLFPDREHVGPVEYAPQITVDALQFDFGHFCSWTTAPRVR